MPRPGRRPAGLCALLGLVVTLSGCIPQGLAFRTDERLTFVTPEDRSTVTLPVTISWRIEDFLVTGPGGTLSDSAGYFAVFVDRTPMPPGEPLRWIARKDNSCRADDGCPDAEYLAGRGVYTTNGTSITLDQLPRTTNDEDRRERHRATVVLLDAETKRIGESAFEIEFDLERKGSA